MKILLADDDATIRSGIETFLKSQNHKIVPVSNGKEALELTEKEKFDLIISDVQMPLLDGIELLKTLREKDGTIPVIIITAFASIENAVKAMKIGANDYLTKPLNLEELKIKIEKIKSEIELKKENSELKEKLRRIEFPEIIGESKAIKEVKKIITKVASNDTIPVMLYGKSGTGKELAARAIHNAGKRRGKPFVAVNCAALPEELLESELFGYVKGAFTGAVNDKDGLFKAADGGTLFLDEVGETSPRLQAKLLRVLQDFQIQPLGTTKSFPVNVRLIGASNRRLQDLIESGKFREDLFYRINVAEITLPNLCERTDDVPILISHFMSTSNAERKISFTKEAMDALVDYDWPGNIRELENFVKTISLFAEKEIIEKEDLPENILNASFTGKHEWNNLLNSSDFQEAQKSALENFEKKFLEYHLKKNDGNISRTADAINLSRVSLHKKINQYGLGN
ncbi:MAG: sigma-54-dependent Fis family transcriptional regulator [Chlorobi bacterium]|nr:sigma-54-dependent Fis family transcriptional regulator [Chlorobiota bacterium]